MNTFNIRLLCFAVAAARLISAASTTDIAGGALAGKVGQLLDGSQAMTVDSSTSSNSPFQLPGFWGVTSPASVSSNKRARWLPRDVDDNAGDNFFLLEKRSAFSLEKRQSNVCRVGGDSCGSSRWCYTGIGCCGNSQMGCNGVSCCPSGSVCCSGGFCCPKGYICVTINGQRGCCKEGAKCNSNGGTVTSGEGLPDTSKSDQCSDSGFGLCPSGDFCCPAGKRCLRDPQGNPSCELGCARTSWSVCPNNNFCCPPNAQCYVDENGNNRCRVFVTTTVVVSPTSTADNNDDGDDDTITDTAEPTPTESNSASAEPTFSSSSSSTSRSYKSTRTISRDKTITVTPGTTSKNTSPGASTGAAAAVPASTTAAPPKQHNGGLDDIFTNSATRYPSPSVSEIILWAVGWAFLSGWFLGR